MALDLSQNTVLNYLNCYNNQLSELDLSRNTTLEWLHCYNNQLSELDLSRNTTLEWLHCYNNQLSELDLSQNTALIHPYCGSQKTSDGEVQQLTLTLTAEQREIWDSIWADATYKNGNNYYVAIEVRNSGSEDLPDTATDTVSESVTDMPLSRR